MKKILMFSIILGVMLMSVGIVVAGSQMQKAGERANNSFTLPENAVEVAPGVFYLGKALDKGRIVEGYAMFVKPGTVCGNGICEPGENANKCPEDCSADDPEEPDTSSCYTLLAKGAKWKTVEPYIVDATNTRELSGAFIRENLAYNIDKWEDTMYTTPDVEGLDILGDEGSGVVDRENIGDLNGANEVMFADIDYEGAIAMAIIWGYFGGPPPFRELVEWDMVFDDTDFDWSEDCDGTDEDCASKMDFENIATHELGHAVGLGDLYNDLCSEQTMYGYASYGEIKKRTLEVGDVNGVKALYG